MGPEEARVERRESNMIKWRQQVNECRNSGMTIRAWCAREGISEDSYYCSQSKVWKADRDAGKSAEAPRIKGPAIHERDSLSAAAIVPCSIPYAETGKAEGFRPALVLRKEAWTVEAAAGCEPGLLELALNVVRQGVIGDV